MKIQVTESDIRHMILEGAMRIMEKITVDPNTGEWFDDEEPDEADAVDPLADAEYKHSMSENLPRGWEKFESEDGKTIYSDPDGNEFVKDEYGKFVPIENNEQEFDDEEEPEVDDAPAGVPTNEEEQLLRESIKAMIRENLAEMGFGGFNNMQFNHDIAEKGTPKSKNSPANQHYKTNPKTNKQARATKRAIVLKWLRDPKQAVNCAEIMRQLWNPSPQDEDTKRGEFYKKRDGAINKQSGARYSFTDEEINQLYRIKSNRS